MSELSVSWGSRSLASCIYQIVHEHDKAFRSCFVGPFSRKRVCFPLLSLYDRNDVQLDSLSLFPNWLPKNPLWCFGFDILEVSSQCFGWNWQGWNLGEFCFWSPGRPGRKHRWISTFNEARHAHLKEARTRADALYDVSDHLYISYILYNSIHISTFFKLLCRLLAVFHRPNSQFSKLRVFERIRENLSDADLFSAQVPM